MARRQNQGARCPPPSPLEVAGAAVVRRARLKGEGAVPQRGLGVGRVAGRRHRTGSGRTHGRAVLIR